MLQSTGFFDVCVYKTWGGVNKSLSRTDSRVFIIMFCLKSVNFNLNTII